MVKEKTSQTEPLMKMTQMKKCNMHWTGMEVLAPLLRHSGPDTHATRMNECTKAVEYKLNIQALPCLYAENCYSSMQRKYVTFLTQEKKM